MTGVEVYEPWFLIGNSYGGAHIGQGETAAKAKAYVRESIAETYAGEGLSPSACRRAASSYRVWLIAGPLSYEEASAARQAWDREDWETALRHGRPSVRRAFALQGRVRV